MIKKVPTILAALAAFSGTLLGILTIPLASGGVVNLFWGTLYGLGFWAISAFVLPEPGWAGLTYLLVGAVLWPLFLTIMIISGFNKLLDDKRLARVVLPAIIISLAIIFPMREARGTVVYYLPLFSAFLENI